MRIVLSDFMSLDGVVQAPGGASEDPDGGFAHGGWSFPFFDPDAMGAAIGGAMDTTEALLFGRRTWQTMAAAWPDRAGDPFADRMNELPKHVASRTLSQAAAVRSARSPATTTRSRSAALPAAARWPRRSHGARRPQRGPRRGERVHRRLGKIDLGVELLDRRPLTAAAVG